ncbi:hypothetical protein ESA94_00875 [Lacibacter luteus]|uniref:PD-(D/E)XK nuclease family protein n=1 Tax=Lacibacter luteus TaxID=2508719 RepID=A0A4Q1CKZ2_9BACT|nr:PD-(D/E)XK nuclease family protein [Lacibacter luteus]RXK61600.1 hypothetical protein ESA94_00875 [Lacibacter luteus]
MTTIDTQLADKLLEVLSTQKNVITAKRLNEYHQIINQPFKSNKLDTSLKKIIKAYSHIKLQTKNRVINENKELLDKFQLIEKKAEQKNKETSCDFNVLKLFSINEPMHSFLLANILNPNSEHGQGNLFLLSFLQKLGIEFPEQGQWTITAEKGRIDVLIKRQHPHSVIVIENKSNYAGDQPNQLYRYWYREIYYPNRHRENDYSKHHPEKYQVVFLTPADWKQPSENTTLRPNNWDTSLPTIMPLETKIWKFSNEINSWLSETYNDIPKENHRLKEYIKQYIEFWQ